MASRLADAHIAAQQRLRALAVAGVDEAWRRLPAYDEDNVPAFVAVVLPLITAAQRQSVALVDAYLARALARAPLGVDPAAATGVAVRAGVPPAEVYRRPFVTVWTALKAGRAWEDAVNAGRARAAGTAAMDVQLSQRAAMQAVQDADPVIRGYQRAADAGACAYCVMIDGAFVKSADAMPLHNGCGCTLEPVIDPVDPTATPDDVAVHDHGELGPVLADPAHDFTSEQDI